MAPHSCAATAWPLFCIDIHEIHYVQGGSDDSFVIRGAGNALPCRRGGYGSSTCRGETRYQSPCNSATGGAAACWPATLHTKAHYAAILGPATVVHDEREQGHLQRLYKAWYNGGNVGSRECGSGAEDRSAWIRGRNVRCRQDVIESRPCCQR